MNQQGVKVSLFLLWSPTATVDDRDTFMFHFWKPRGIMPSHQPHAVAGGNVILLNVKGVRNVAGCLIMTKPTDYLLWNYAISSCVILPRRRIQHLECQLEVLCIYQLDNRSREAVTFRQKLKGNIQHFIILIFTSFSCSVWDVSVLYFIDSVSLESSH